MMMLTFQNAWMDFYKVSSMKQQSASRHVILILSKQVLALTS
jgi:hypothetical protein